MIRDCTKYLEQFISYHLNNPAWGSLHNVLEDANYEDRHIEHCIRNAKLAGDQHGVELGQMLLQMSLSQRAKISKLT